VRGGAVIASEAKQSTGLQRKNGLLRRYRPLRKRFAFVAGNDAAANVVFECQTAVTREGDPDP
jgi:hypothetical protein